MLIVIDFKIQPFSTSLNHVPLFWVSFGLDQRKPMKAMQQGTVTHARTNVDVASTESFRDFGKSVFAGFCDIAGASVGFLLSLKVTAGAIHGLFGDCGISSSTSSGAGGWLLRDCSVSQMVRPLRASSER